MAAAKALTPIPNRDTLTSNDGKAPLRASRPSGEYSNDASTTI